MQTNSSKVDKDPRKHGIEVRKVEDVFDVEVFISVTNFELMCLSLEKRAKGD